MQSLRSTSVRRLCLSLATSVPPRQKNPLLSTLFCYTRSFTSPSPARNMGFNQFSRNTTEDGFGENSREFGGGRSAQQATKSPTSTLYVANLPYSTTEHDLQEIFSEFGSVTRASIGRTHDGTSKGYAHIEFSTKRDAIEATKNHEESPLVIDGRTVRIDYGYPWVPKGEGGLPRRAVKDRFGPGPTVFVGNLNETATEEDVLEALRPHGKVVAVRLGRARDGTPKGFAHADFEDTGEAEKVLAHYQHNPIAILEQDVRLDRASPTASAHPPSPRLYFSRWEGDESSLRAHFRALGSKIVDLFPHRSEPDAETISGFVEFRDLETAKEALARFNSPELSLAYSRPRDRDRQGARSGFKRKDTEWRGRGPRFGLANKGFE